MTTAYFFYSADEIRFALVPKTIIVLLLLAGRYQFYVWVLYLLLRQILPFPSLSL